MRTRAVEVCDFATALGLCENYGFSTVSFPCLVRLKTTVHRKRNRTCFALRVPPRPSDIPDDASGDFRIVAGPHRCAAIAPQAAITNTRPAHGQAADTPPAMSGFDSICQPRTQPKPLSRSVIVANTGPPRRTSLEPLTREPPPRQIRTSPKAPRDHKLNPSLHSALPVQYSNDSVRAFQLGRRVQELRPSENMQTTVKLVVFSFKPRVGSSASARAVHRALVGIPDFRWHGNHCGPGYGDNLPTCGDDGHVTIGRQKCGPNDNNRQPDGSCPITSASDACCKERDRYYYKT